MHIRRKHTLVYSASRFAKIRERGMSLVEVMAVLFIITMMTTLVALARPKAPAPVNTQMDRLLVLLNTAAQDSLISGQVYGFGITRDEYALYKFTDGAWEEQSGDLWPDELSIRLNREGQSLKLPKENIPIILFDPTGMSTAFELTLSGPQNSATLISTGNGRVERRFGS